MSPASMVRRLLILLASPGQGLFVFVPLAGVAFVRAMRATAHSAVRIGFVAGFASLALYVVLDRSSTWCWGPRYLFPSMILWWPALVGIRRRLLWPMRALACLGGLVALLGVVVNFHDGIEEIKAARGFQGWEWVAHVQRDPRLSPILWHARLLIPYLERTASEGMARGASRPPVEWRHRHVDIVWAMLWVGNAPPWVLGVPPVLAFVGCTQVRAFARRNT